MYPSEEESKQFYKQYLLDHWLYKQSMLYNTIKNYEQVKSILQKDVTNIKDEDYLWTMKIEIHFTYFQMIETLFNMTFSFYRKEIDNNYLWLYLSSLGGQHRKEVYEKIKNIAVGKTEFLDAQVKANKDNYVSFLQYLFYFDCLSEDNIPTKKNLEVIKKMLINFGADFTDRDDYNAYKHSMCFIPSTESKLEILEAKSGRQMGSFKMGNSLQILRVGKDKSITTIRKPFDYERDFRMSVLCFQLISNLILSRRVHFYKDESVSLTYFDDIVIEEWSKIDSQLGTVEMKVTPIYSK
ncbi:MAG: hypothetical protein FJ218_05100 [Ignavibacteria bacterium]|nr:hypothetical protein [Ignavibacteria bacterium]